MSWVRIPLVTQKKSLIIIRLLRIFFLWLFRKTEKHPYWGRRKRRFQDCTHAFFKLDKEIFSITRLWHFDRSLAFQEFEAYKQRKTNSPFSEMGYSFSGEHISLFSKRAVRFFLFLLAKVHKSVGFGRERVVNLYRSCVAECTKIHIMLAKANRFMNFRQ